MLMREWATATEIADMRLPEMPDTAQGVHYLIKQGQWNRPEWRNTHWRDREGRGGGREYRFSVLPPAPRAEWVKRFTTVDVAIDSARAEERSTSFSSEWRIFALRPDSQRQEAGRRKAILLQLAELERGGTKTMDAYNYVSAAHKVPPKTIRRWRDAVKAINPGDWLPFLAPNHTGRTARAECTPAAWDFFQAEYLRLEQPTLQQSYRVLKRAAVAQGWIIPSAATLERRIKTDLAPEHVILARQGERALKAMYPPQTRDRSVFVAGQAVNADGHKIDVFVRWPDGVIGRPIILAFQDLYSGMMLSWRCDRTENKELVRLAYGDVVDNFTIPDYAYLDNGRGFASKWITGGTKKRHRFKHEGDDLEGVMKTLGTEPIFVTPYSGQSKPIERAFRDWANNIAKDARFAGAYTGNNPMAKPENYGSKAIPLDDFLRVVAEGVVEHNERVGRDTRICQRRLSFRQAFDESFIDSQPHKLPEEMRRLWLMASEVITARKPDASLILHGNRFHADFLYQFMGQRVQVRFDPQNLHDDLFVYTMDGRFLGQAPCLEAVGFNDIAAAQQHARDRKTFMKVTKQALELQRRKKDVSGVAAILNDIPLTDAPVPETKVVRLFSGNAALALPVQAAPELLDEEDDAFTRSMRAWRSGNIGVDAIVGGED